MLGLMGLSLFSCSGGSVGVPERNKMPEFVESDRFEAGFSEEPWASGYPAEASAFAANPIDLTIDGQTQGFYQIPLPDASNDSLAFRLLSDLKPFAVPLLINWAQQERHGVLLDLRARREQVAEQSNFELKVPGYRIPVIVKWDQASAYRVEQLTQFMQEESMIQFIKTN